jgi:glutathione S-transferase
VTALTLHNYDLDEQCYKVRLLLAALGCRYVKKDVDVHPGHEERSARYLKLNPHGALPVITEGDVVLYGAEAILVYLAGKYDAKRTWLPEEPKELGGVMQWLAFAAGDLRPASLARAHALLEVDADEQKVLRASRDAFRIMDDYMTRREFDDGHWFVGATRTIADIALFPAIALSRDFGIDHDEYPALRRWMVRLRTIPGFVTMPGIPSYH